jgi:hypothetical protein
MIDRLQNLLAEKATLGSIIMEPIILDEIDLIYLLKISHIQDTKKYSKHSQPAR